MGGATSKISVSEREKILKDTAGTRILIDTILEYLIENIELREFYSLSNPEKCKKYVLYMANTLSSKFYEFKLYPSMDKSGSIMFRSVDDLTTPPEPERKLRQDLCVRMSYFFVRIFQIYGALAISLFDNAESMSQSGYLTSSKMGALTLPGSVPFITGGPSKGYMFDIETRDKERPQQRIERQPERRIEGQSEYGRYDRGPHDRYDRYNRRIERQPEYGRYDRYDRGYYGGAIAKQHVQNIAILGLFGCLQSILYERQGVYDQMNIRKFILDAGMTTGPAWTFNLDKPFEGITVPSHGIKETAYIIGKVSTGYSLILVATISASDSGSIRTIEISPIAYKVKKPEGTKEVTPINLKERGVGTLSFTLRVIDEVRDRTGRPQYIWGRDRSPVGSIMNNFLTNVWSKIIDDFPGDYSRSDTDRYVSRKGELTDITGAHKSLQVGKLYIGLTRRRKYSHCVSRALQLLQVSNSLSFDGTHDKQRSNQVFMSYICKADVPHLKAASILPGESLGDVDGITTLVNLYFDVIDQMTPKIGSQESIKEYTEAMRKFAKSFVSTKSTSIDMTDPYSTLKSINPSERDRAMCGNKYGKAIELPAALARNKIQPIVTALYGRQMAHARDCAIILKQLFNLSMDKGKYSIRIHENIYKNGIKEINRIARMARAVLVNYYTDCEEKYLEGAETIREQIRSMQPAVTVPVTGTGTGPAIMEAQRAQAQRAQQVAQRNQLQLTRKNLIRQQ
jgi:hypothetical protein